MVSYIIEIELRIDHECLEEEREDDLLKRGKGPKSYGRWIKGRLAGRENNEKIRQVG